MPDTDKYATPILCIPVASLSGAPFVRGWLGQPWATETIDPLLVPWVASWVPRRLAEDDPTLLQVIPYIVIRHGDSVFCYTRGVSGGEKRLYRKRSLGIGGHVDESDKPEIRLAAEDSRAGFERTMSCRFALMRAMTREISEEVKIESPVDMKLVGLIYDPTPDPGDAARAVPVGAVHLGLVYEMRLAEPCVTPNEAALTDPAWERPGEIAAAGRVEAFEGWSRIVLREWLVPALVGEPIGTETTLEAR